MVSLLLKLLSWAEVQLLRVSTGPPLIPSSPKMTPLLFQPSWRAYQRQCLPGASCVCVWCVSVCVGWSKEWYLLPNICKSMWVLRDTIHLSAVCDNSCSEIHLGENLSTLKQRWTEEGKGTASCWKSWYMPGVLFRLSPVRPPQNPVRLTFSLSTFLK